MPALLLKILAVLIILYFLLGAYAWLASNSMIFHPEHSRQPDPPHVFKIRNADGALISALYLKNDSARHTILFSYGNASSLSDSYEFLQRLNTMGFSVLSYDYRGYGSSQGQPSERNLYQDIEAAYTYLTDSLGISPCHIVAYGQSLGGAVAVNLASRRKLGGLIVESSFVSAFRVMTKVPLFPFDKFNSIGKMEKVHCPLLVIHGDSDRTIPLWHGQALFRKAPKQRMMVVIPGGGHLSVPPESQAAYQKAIADFISSLP